MNIVLLERAPESDEIQKLHQRQQPAERRQPLRALPIRRVRCDDRPLRCPPFRSLALTLLPPPFSSTLAPNPLGYLLSAWLIYSFRQSYSGSRMVPQPRIKRSRAKSRD
jgi:hypothetical protein